MKEDWLEGKNEYPLPKDLDLDTVWNEIEDKRKKKKKRRFLIFFFPSVLCIAILMTWFYMANDPLSSTAIDMAIVKNIELELNSGVGEGHEPSSMINEVESLVVTEENELEKLEPLKKVNIASKVLKHNNVNHKNYKNVNIDLASALNEKVVESISVAGNNFNPLLVMSEGSDLEGKTKAVLLKKNQGVSSESISTKDQGVDRSRDKVESLVHLKMLDISIFVPLRKLRKRRMPRIRLPFEKESFVGLRLMGGKAGRSFTSNSSAVDNEYFERRNASESVLNSTGVDCYIRRILSPNIFLESGISISSVTIKSNHQYEVRSSDQLEQDSAVVVHYLDGSVGYSAGDVTAYVTETYNSVKYNRFWSVGIPLRVGYMKALTDKSKLLFSTGMIYNFYASGIGSVVAMDEEKEIFTDPTELGYTRKNLLQSTSQVFLNYRLSSLWTLEFGLNYNFDINSRTTSELESDKFSSLNASLGINYKL